MKVSKGNIIILHMLKTIKIPTQMMLKIKILLMSLICYINEKCKCEG